MIHTMLDLETMGTKSGCAIFSIGAVKFDPDAGTLGETFYNVIDLNDCYKIGLRADPSTVYWWLGQSKEAQAELLKDRAPLVPTLERFGFFLVGNQRLWSHGATFDIPILEAAYCAAKLKLPWTYKQGRDTRTLFDVAGSFDRTKPMLAHHALQDAIAQARDVITAWRKVARQ